MSKLKKKFVAQIVKLAGWVRRHEWDSKIDRIEGCVVIGDRQKIEIGRSVSFGGNVTLFANARIEIGNHTMVGINSLFHTSTHNYNNHPMWIERIDRPIRIGSNVWVGASVIICPGVIVGDYAVIGAGSVVVANVPEFAIVAGNPARIINYRDKGLLNKGVKLEYPENAFVSRLDYIDKECKRNIN